MDSAARRKPTPLDPHSFFTGVWSGEGELLPSRLLRLVIPQEHFRYTGTINWLSDSAWEVLDRYEFARGQVIDLHLSIEMVGNHRLHATSANIPGGADILLSQDGFSFTPYTIQIKRRGLRLRLRCFDTNHIGTDGIITNTIQMHFLGLPVATMLLWVTAERSSS
jgi:hypothetical protein